jgi:hypothetical protein
VTSTQNSKDELFLSTLTDENLQKAWSYIYSKSKKSASDIIRNEAMEFHSNLKENLQNLKKALLEDKFKFKGSKGVLKLNLKTAVEHRPTILI